MRGRRRRRWLVGVVALALAGLVALVVVRGDRPGPDLEALRADPVARWVPHGATLARHRENTGGSSLGKPVYARVTRIFHTDQAGAAVAEAQVVARRHGWRVDHERPGAFSASRHVPGWRLDLTVVRARVKGVPGNLFVYLVAYPA